MLQHKKFPGFYRIAEPGFPILKQCGRMTRTELFSDDRLISP